MQWIQYLIFAVLLWLIIKRFLPVKDLTNLTAAEVKELLKHQKDHLFLDVREVHEYREGHIKGFKNYPLSQLAHKVNELDPNKSVVLTCRSGMRSRQAAKILKKKGFNKISHLKTGIIGWDGDLVR